MMYEYFAPLNSIKVTSSGAQCFKKPTNILSASCVGAEDSAHDNTGLNDCSSWVFGKSKIKHTSPFFRISP